MAEPGTEGGDNKPAFTDVEATARRMGWKPEDEYRGPKDKWKPASEFVEEAMGNYPVLMDRYRVLDERAARTQRDLERANGQLVDIGKAVTEMRDFHAQSLQASELRAYNQARADIEEEIRQATKDADPAKADAAMAKLRALDEKKPAAEPDKTKPAAGAGAGAAAEGAGAQPGGGAQQPQLQPEVLAWVEKNPWYNSHEDANVLAVTVHKRLAATRKDLTLAQNLEMVSEEVKKRFPELFEGTAPAQRNDGDGGDPPRRAAASVTESTVGGAPGGGGGARGRTYADLPADAKAACDRFTKTMIKGPDGKDKPMMTREEYLAQYPWEN